MPVATICLRQRCSEARDYLDHGRVAHPIRSERRFRWPRSQLSGSLPRLMLQAAASPMMAAPAFAELMGFDTTLVLVTLVASTALTSVTAPLFAWTFIAPTLPLTPLTLAVRLWRRSALRHLFLMSTHLDPLPCFYLDVSWRPSSAGQRDVADLHARVSFPRCPCRLRFRTARQLAQWANKRRTAASKTRRPSRQPRRGPRRSAARQCTVDCGHAATGDLLQSGQRWRPKFQIPKKRDLTSSLAHSSSGRAE
jgi:hypothetical protein